MATLKVSADGQPATGATTASRATGYSAPTVSCAFRYINDAGNAESSAALAAEVPVALVYNARPHVVMMCTPADIEDLAYGFTITEQIAGAADITRVAVVRYARGIELQIEVSAAAAGRLDSRARSMVARTGCGLCGVEAIDAAVREVPLVRSAAVVPRGALWRAIESLGEQQLLNRGVHAIHAAAWASLDGTVRLVREDVGRHNALDKVIGALARAGTDASAGFALVTSRASYELVQKAAVANVPLLGAVSRPTALAVQLADDAGITLVGMLRDRTANVYTHEERIT